MKDNKSAIKLAVEMHKEFDALDTDLYLNFELIDKIWVNLGDEIKWNDDNDPIDLFEGCGETYSIETYRGMVYEDEEHLLINGNDGCGNQSDYLFLKEKELEDH